MLFSHTDPVFLFFFTFSSRSEASRCTAVASARAEKVSRPNSDANMLAVSVSLVERARERAQKFCVCRLVEYQFFHSSLTFARKKRVVSEPPGCPGAGHLWKATLRLRVTQPCTTVMENSARTTRTHLSAPRLFTGSESKRANLRLISQKEKTHRAGPACVFPQRRVLSLDSLPRQSANPSIYLEPPPS